MDPGDVLREVNGDTEIDVTVSPNASRSGIEKFDPWRGRLVIKVRAMPKDGRANRELCEFLSELFCAPVNLVKGQTSRTKTIRVHLDKDRVREILEEFI